MRILALDQATKTGWALFDNDKLIDYGIEDFTDIKDFPEKVNAIKHWYTNKIKETKAEVFALENVQYQTNARVHRDLSKLLGVLENYLLDNKYLYIIVDNGEWKSTCGVKGRKRVEQKKNAQLFVKRKFGIEVSDDIADSICIAWHLVCKYLDKIEIKSNS